MYYINIRQTRQVISRLLITFVNYKLQKHLVEIFCLYTGNLFMKGFCVLYPKIFISDVFIKPKLPGIQDKNSFFVFNDAKETVYS